jgi:hypothetical protein
MKWTGSSTRSSSAETVASGARTGSVNWYVSCPLATVARKSRAGPEATVAPLTAIVVC